MKLLVLLCLAVTVASARGQVSECQDCASDISNCPPNSTHKIPLSTLPHAPSHLLLTCEDGRVTFAFEGNENVRLTKFETIDKHENCTRKDASGKILTGKFHDCLRGGFKKNDEDTCFQASNNVIIEERIPNSLTGMDFVLKHNVHASCCMKVAVVPGPPQPTINDEIKANMTACEYFHFDINPPNVCDNLFGWEVKPSKDKFALFHPTEGPFTNWYVDNCYAVGSGSERAQLVSEALLSKDFVYWLPRALAEDPDSKYYQDCQTYFLGSPQATACPIQNLRGERNLGDPSLDSYQFSVPAFAIEGNTSPHGALQVHCDIKICSTYQAAGGPDHNPTVFNPEYFDNVPLDKSHCAWKFGDAVAGVSQLFSAKRSLMLQNGFSS